MDLKNTELPIILKDLRKEAGFTQEQLAPRLGLARETIDNLSVETVGKWWSVCRTKARENTRQRFVNQIMGYFKIILDKL